MPIAIRSVTIPSSKQNNQVHIKQLLTATTTTELLSLLLLLIHISNPIPYHAIFQNHPVCGECYCYHTSVFCNRTTNRPECYRGRSEICRSSSRQQPKKFGRRLQSISEEKKEAREARQKERTETTRERSLSEPKTHRTNQ